jgi:hypothetical protein
MALVSLFGGWRWRMRSSARCMGWRACSRDVQRAARRCCGRLLPFVIEANVRALRKREPDSEVLERYDEIAVISHRRLGL